MATAVAPTSVQVNPFSAYFKPTRLVGTLAVGVDFTTDDAFFERINVSGASKIIVSLKTSGTAVVGTLSLDMHRMDSTASSDDTDSATRLTVGSPSAATFTSINEQKEIEMTVEGVEFVEVEVTEGSGGSDVHELAFVDVFLTPL